MGFAIEGHLYYRKVLVDIEQWHAEIGNFNGYIWEYLGNKYKIPKKVMLVRFGNCFHMATLGIVASLTFYNEQFNIFIGA